MSDARTFDRLRAAADRLDGQWSDDTDWTLEATTWDEGAQGWRVVGHATHEVAALLRAVADESEVCCCGPEYTERGLARPGCPAHDVMIASRDAALDVARTILGDTDD